MQLLLKYVREYKWLLVGTLLLATINQGFSLLDPQIFRMMIDRFASHPQDFTSGQFLKGIFVLLLLSIGVAFVSRVAKNFQDYFTSVITQRVGTKLYAHAVEHSFSLPYATFEDQRSGELLQKLSKAREDAKQLIQAFIGTIFVSGISMLIVIIYAFTVHWSIGLLYFLIVPVLGATIFAISKKIKIAQKEIVKESAALAGSTTETLRNVELVKSLGLEEQEINRLNTTNELILELELKKLRLIRVLSFIQGTLVNAIRASLLFLMLWLIFKGTITVGELFSLFIYSFYIFGTIQEFGNVSAKYYETRASLDQVEAILNIPSEDRPEHPMHVGPLAKIEFNKVTFGYQNAHRDAVADLNFSIKAGERIAFVGPSGSGKTTIIKLIAGLYAPTSGSLLINGVANDKIDYVDIRKRIGLVSQDTQLFAGTIRDNLLFVSPFATDAQCLDALARAQALPVISKDRGGLDARIGEGGIKLSGGEKQRLAIARALLRNPELIIFDEATSALDSITEKAITETIEKVTEENKNTINIWIAHRLSTIMRADKIYVLEQGKIVESGTHAALLKKKGLYNALWREQGGETITNV